MNAKAALGAVVFVACVFATAALAKDVAGSKDSPVLKRYEGSTIIKYSTNAFDAYTLPTGPSAGQFNTANLPKTAKLEGKVTRITYLVPAGRSGLEVVRNYQNEMKAAGYTVLYKGSGAELGNKPWKINFATAAGYASIRLSAAADLTNIMGLAEKDDVYLAARLDRPEGTVHAAVYAVPVSKMAHAGLGLQNIAQPEQVLVQVDIIEAKPMETRMVTVLAGEMSEAIAERGSVALYGIYFDTNSAEVKAESAPTLEQIGKLMKAEPRLKLLVVGHTDSVGTFESNMDLSARRAKSVVQVLTSKHGVDGKRLVPVGVSFASPIASNRSEDGKGKNRRVQLVEF